MHEDVESMAEPQRGLVLQALLAEYQSLRAESLAAIGHRVQIVNFTFGAIAVFVGGIVAGRFDRVATALVCALFLPSLAKAASLIWLGEYQRSQRAGRGIAPVEQRVNKLLGGFEAMTWETWLLAQARGAGDSHMSYPYRAAVGVILGSGALAEVVGIVAAANEFAARGWDTAPRVAAVCAVAAVVLVNDAVFMRFFRKKWIAIRAASSADPGGPIG